ncbi:hypothetical protein HMPREF9098_0411 [Kingella denitrificans ATCC 33394]|uniref:Uncharacterized protein n=1 Tax=Kingella denitrificans ATCC 33394 TaxID=888741 RepID=F0EX31_9NEIS|nr:hypothetical protein HMPREF9098_0411 [Kingella denitrificans ATCC 33394]
MCKSLLYCRKTYYHSGIPHHGCRTVRRYFNYFHIIRRNTT